MGMKIVGTSIEQAIINLTQTGERAVKGVSAVLQKGGEQIAETAKVMAPVEHGDLINAIKALPMKGDNNRKEIVVTIDPDAVDERGVSVLYYGTIMNEALEPYGTGGYKLGKLSKALRASGAPIGGKFMERALKEHRADIIEKANTVAKNVGSRS